MLKIYIFILGLISNYCSITNAQNSYITIKDGSWNNNSTWLNSNRPPFTLPYGDNITISHNITYNSKINIKGSMLIQANGSVISSNNKDLHIGKDETNKGSIINYGEIDTGNKNLKLEQNSCGTNDTLPKLRNFGIIRTNELKVGKDCRSGIFVNEVNAKVYAEKFHIHGLAIIKDSMFLTDKIDQHGGILTGGGFIETPKVKSHDSKTNEVPIFRFITICDNNFSPEIEIDGDVFIELFDAINQIGNNSGQINIDLDSTYICSGNSLPVELLEFKSVVKNNKIELTFKTSSEKNSSHFHIEKLIDDKWLNICKIYSYGNSSSTNQYNYIDINPIKGDNYYRLKQIDINGNFEYLSKIVQNYKITYSKISITPNPSKNIIEITNLNTDVVFYNRIGENVTDKVEKINNLNNIYNISNLENGIYFIKTENEVLKFLKQ